MKIGILLFDDVEELDFAGPWEVLTAAARLTTALEVTALSGRMEPIRAAKGLRLLPDAVFADAPPLDVLVVPGGSGARRGADDPELVAFVRRAAEGCRFVVSVCTGAWLLHAAGLLDGKRATTHWAYVDQLEALGGVRVVRDARYVRDGAVVTAAGVSAGIDVSLWVVGALFDRGTARRVQRLIEYDPAPPYAAEA